MMRIAILVATSQIPRGLIVSFSGVEDKHPRLFSRRPDEVAKAALPCRVKFLEQQQRQIAACLC